jgi:uncharacterized protein (TIGR02145 family)
MKKLFIVTICFFALVTSNGQAVEQRLPGAEEISNRRTSFNLEEIKVRWKKAALENCTGVPCIVTPPAPPFTCGTNTVSDIDGNTYNTVLIGTQCWTKSNLKVTKYNDGTDIPEITGSQTWDNTVVTGARTVYNDDPVNLTRYGYLYNWFAAKGISTGGSIIYKNICPTGWHVPTDKEWESLIRFIDPLMTVQSSVGTESSIAGKKLKSSSTLWQTDPNPGTDDFGFSALPGGRRLQSGFDFSEVEQRAYFWSTDLFTNGRGFTRLLFYNDSSVSKDNYNTVTGRSIRCIKD